MKQHRREYLYWWEAAFFIDCPDPEHPKWHVDLFIAHRSLAPVLDKYGHLIGIWRFHRRAAPDETGHKFTFYFYATRRTARRVLPEIRTHPSIQELKNLGVVLRDQYDDSNKRNPKACVGDLSDPNWSREVKEAWPYYAMGISRMLLSLVNECYEEEPGDPKDPDTLLDHYERVNEEIVTRTFLEGKHAFLHHLNALMGYGEIRIPQYISMRF